MSKVPLYAPAFTRGIVVAICFSTPNQRAFLGACFAGPLGGLQGHLAHKKPPPLGPYSRTMPWALWWPWGKGGCFFMGEVPLYEGLAPPVFVPFTFEGGFDRICTTKSLQVDSPPPRTFSRAIPGVLRWPKVGGLFLMSEVPLYSHQHHSTRHRLPRRTTLEATQGQMSSQSSTDSTRFWWHLYGS